MKITLDHITKKFDETIAVNDFTAQLPSGQLLCLLGPSGCGKSTILNMLSGIIPVTSGRIFFDDRDVTESEPEKRGIGLVFQNYSLYPHMSVLENICFPLEIQGVRKSERIRRATELAEMVYVDNLLKRRPAQLSGGQQQRVAIARALVKNPQLLLLDEPLSNLDARLRIEMREEIRRIQQETRVTTIFVTHDQEEAMSISDQIILMKDGYLQQIAGPLEIYRNPANEFTADFLGNPVINKLAGVVRGGKIAVRGADRPISVPGAEKIADGREVHLSIRAESFDPAPAVDAGADDPDNFIEGSVAALSVTGKDTLANVRIGDFDVRAFIDSDETVRAGEMIRLTLKPRGVFVFDAQSGDRLV